MLPLAPRWNTGATVTDEPLVPPHESKPLTLLCTALSNLLHIEKE